MKKLILLAVLATMIVGCQTQRDWYKEQGWTPDGFNYTAARERKSGEWCDYFGASWSLK